MMKIKSEIDRIIITLFIKAISLEKIMNCIILDIKKFI